MNPAVKMRCVSKSPGEPPKIIGCDRPRDLFHGAVSSVPFDLRGKQVVIFDDNFVAKRLPANIMHPTRRGYYELCGPVVIVGVDRDGEYCSLEDDAEAERVCIRLRELSVPADTLEKASG